MAEDPKTPPQAAADKPPADAPAEPLKGEVSRTDAPGAEAPAAKPASAVPPTAGAPAGKPPAPAAAKPAAPAHAAAPAPPSGPPDPAPPADKTPPAYIAALGSAVSAVSYWAGDWTIIVPVAQLAAVLERLRDSPEASFDYLSDLTATDWPPRAAGRFDVVYVLYSMRHRHRLRVKTIVGENQPVPSATATWPAAN